MPLLGIAPCFSTGMPKGSLASCLSTEDDPPSSALFQRSDAQRWERHFDRCIVLRVPQVLSECTSAATAPSVSAEDPDWSREKPRRLWDPGRRLLLAIRHYQYWRAKAGLIPTILRKWFVARHRFWSVVTGADIPLTCEIGGGLLIPHPNGIVIHPEAKIGVNCLIFQQVTIGTSDRSGVPHIGGHVDIGAGAKILGPVSIGAHARIGANAVVLADVSRSATVVGIPARAVR
jgi:serine O-acetyltransferase